MEQPADAQPGPMDAGGESDAGRRDFLRTFGRGAARSAGQLAGALTAVSGAPIAIGAELLGMTPGAPAPPTLPPPRPPALATPRMPASPPPMDLRPWRIDGDALWVVDQRSLPGARRELRGDPVPAAMTLLDGLAVPFGPVLAEVAMRAFALGARAALGRSQAPSARSLGWNLTLLRGARPSSGALAAAVSRMEALLGGIPGTVDHASILAALEAEVDDLIASLATACTDLVTLGADVLAHRLGPAPGLLTIGTSGPLAGGAVGTAIGLIAEIARRVPGTRAWIAETRPTLVGARIGALELARLGVPVTVVPDTAAAELARVGRIAAAVVPMEGDAGEGGMVGVTGTHALAALLAGTDVPVLVAAPSLVRWVPVPVPQPSGAGLRPAIEVLSADGRRVAAPSADGWAPLVEATPWSLVGGIVDETGVRPLRVG